MLLLLLKKFWTAPGREKETDRVYGSVAYKKKENNHKQIISFQRCRYSEVNTCTSVLWAIKFLAHRFSNSCPQVASLWALQQINPGNSAVKAEFCLLEITWLLTKLKENGILMWLVTLNHRRHSICNGQVRFTVLNQVIPWKHLSLKPHLFTILKIIYYQQLAV